MANPDQLTALFDGMVSVLLSKVQDGTATPQDMRVAAQLIKDSGVDVMIEKNKNVSRLAGALPFPTLRTIDRQEAAENF
jgi:hypothetical protein